MHRKASRRPRHSRPPLLRVPGILRPIAPLPLLLIWQLNFRERSVFIDITRFIFRIKSLEDALLADRGLLGLAVEGGLPLQTITIILIRQVDHRRRISPHGLLHHQCCG